MDKDRLVKYRQIKELLRNERPAVHAMLHDPLKIKKVCTLWVPHTLTDEQKAHRVKWCKNTQKKFQHGRSHDIVRLYYFDVPTKLQIRLSLFEDEAAPTEVRKSRSLEKKTIAVFFGKRGIIAKVMLNKQKTITYLWYTQTCLCQVLKKRKEFRPRSSLSLWVFH